MSNYTYYVYKHVFPNNKIYIGITSRLPKARWGKNGNGYLTLRKNKYPSQPKMYHAIKKYGWNNIQHEILAIVKTKEEATVLEKYYIDLYKSTLSAFGYNIEKGGKYGGKGFFQDLGRCWWNDGKHNKISIKCPGKNWKKGKFISEAERLTYKNRSHTKYTYAHGKLKFKFKIKKLGIIVYNPTIKEKTLFEKKSENSKGRSWWNNGIEQKFVRENPGPGWINKRLYTGNEGSHWWNNGVCNKFCKNCPGIGWKLGMKKVYD